MVLIIIGCVVMGYAFGCISTAYIVGKCNHIDIRTYGSGNAGTTNAMRTLGKKAGAITFIGDLLKALIPLLLVRLVFFPDSEKGELLGLYTGLGVVLGHNYPFWLKFKGGKGVAVTTGVFFGTDWLMSIFGTICFILTAAITKYVSVASLLSVIVSCILLILHNGPDLHLTIVVSLYAIFSVWRHRLNIKRLIKGTENKIGANKVPLVEDIKSNDK